MQMKGFGDLELSLDKLKSRMHEIEGVPMGELYNPDFISKHTRFNDLKALFNAGGFECETEEELEAICSEKLDAFIAKESSFSDWRDMTEMAMGEWLKKKLNS